MTATIQKLTRGSVNLSGSYAEYTTVVKDTDCEDLNDAITGIVAGEGLWLGDDQAEPCDDGTRYPLCSDDGESYYLHMAE